LRIVQAHIELLQELPHGLGGFSHEAGKIESAQKRPAIAEARMTARTFSSAAARRNAATTARTISRLNALTGGRSSTICAIPSATS